jgi:ATP-binding cassette subfamily D (ALD) long-chain fatty acid import protein
VCVPRHPLTSQQAQLDSSETKPNLQYLTTNSGLESKSKEPSVDDPDTLSGPTTTTTTLVRALTLTLRPGMHLMITGSNGVGKTAVARVLAGLWAPGSNSTLTRPTEGADGRPGVFVIPQRSYHPTGSLLSQVIYPQSVSEFTSSVEALDELGSLLYAASLGYLVDREGGWDTVKEWRDVLSGGEKQRVSRTSPFGVGANLVLEYSWPWPVCSIIAPSSPF